MGELKKAARLLSSYGRSFILPTPVQVAVQVAEACDAKCTYCPRKQDSEAAISLEDFILILDRVKKLGAGYFNITGGEPLIWKPLIPALALLHQSSISAFVSTNGFSLNDALTDQLGEAGLDALNVSLDGIEPSSISPKTLANHDAGFSKRLFHLKREYGTRVSINGVITEENIDQIPLLIAYARDNDFMLSFGLAVQDLTSVMNKPVLPVIPEKIRKLIRLAFKDKVLVEPLEYFSNPFAPCYDAKKTSICIDPKMELIYCFKTKGRSGIYVKDLTQETLAKYLEGFKANSDICNPYCVANCLYLSAYSKRHPLRTLMILLESKIA